MKIVWLSLFCLFATQALGQRSGGVGGFGQGGLGRGRVITGGFPGGFSRGGFGRGGVVQGGVRPGNRVVVIGGFGFPSQSLATFGIPPLGPIPPLGGSAPLSAFGNSFGFGHRFSASSTFLPSAFPLLLGGDDSGYPAASNIIIMEHPFPQTIVQQSPRQTVRSEIHEYKPTATAEPVPAEEQPAFALVLKDGSVQSAVAVSVQDEVLHYVDPDGQHWRVPLDTVDREATRRVNREQKLELHLPPPTAK